MYCFDAHIKVSVVILVLVSLNVQSRFAVPFCDLTTHVGS